MKPISWLISGMVWATLLVLAGIAWAQHQTLDRLRSEMRVLTQAMGTSPLPSKTTGSDGPSPSDSNLRTAWTDRALMQRIEALERSMANFSAAREHLIQRGQLPLTPEGTEDLTRTLMSSTRSDQERLQALRLLRRNRALTDDLVQYAAGWIETVNDPEMRQNLLGQLEGVTNAAMRDPLLRLVADAHAQVREQAVENLEPFMSDPAVEEVLWEKLRNDPDEDVREQAGDVLREGRRTEAQLASLRARAVDPQATLDEQVTALRALREAEAPIPEILGAWLQRAENSPNPQERARLYDALDGFNDPELKAPLVQALQDPNAVVRQRAADALSTFASDPAVQEWLRHVAQNDVDPRVQREALDALPAP